jgi:hypothetical protein
MEVDMTIRNTALALAIAGVATAATITASGAQVLIPRDYAAPNYYNSPNYYGYSYGPGIYLSVPSYTPYRAYRYYYED